MFKELMLPIMLTCIIFYKPIQRIFREKLLRIRLTANTIYVYIPVILLKETMYLVNLWSSAEVKHWSIENYRRILAVFSNNGGGGSYHMSMAWIQGILKYKLAVTGDRSFPASLRYYQLSQEDIQGQQIQGIVHYETKRSSDIFDLLAEIWLGADSFTGYVIGIFPKDGGPGHACAFTKEDDRGYVMLPNAGLNSYTTLLSFYECLTKYPAFEAIMEGPYDVKMESFKWNHTRKQSPSILECVSAASLEYVIKLYNTFRGVQVKHWSTQELEENTYRGLMNSIDNVAGVCMGMSMTWIEGVLKYNLPPTTKPSLYLAVLYQELLHRVPFEETQGIVQYTNKSSRSRFDLLTDIWTDFENHESSGYIITMFTEDQGEEDNNGHACAFIKVGKTGYLLVPNAGLYSFTSLLSFNECFLKEHAFRRMEEGAFVIDLESYKWN